MLTGPVRARLGFVPLLTLCKVGQGLRNGPALCPGDFISRGLCFDLRLQLSDEGFRAQEDLALQLHPYAR